MASGEAGSAPERTGSVVRVPAFVQGELIVPAPAHHDWLEDVTTAADGDQAGHGAPDADDPEGDTADRWYATPTTWVVRQATVDGATLGGEARRYLLLPRVDPATLIEHDPAALTRDLHDLPVEAIIDFLHGLQQVVRRRLPVLRDAVHAIAGEASRGGEATTTASLAALADILDGDALGRAVDAELGSPTVPGRRYLDSWVTVDEAVHPGITSTLGSRLGLDTPSCGPASLRAFGTRQLHITAGNDDVVPLVSLLRGWVTKGAVVVKSPARSLVAATALALALSEHDPQHPLARHTSLVSWPGGERSVEDVLFAPGAFDRLVLWGGGDTVRSVRERAGHLDPIVFGPKVSFSLIGRCGDDELVVAARRGAADTVISDQAACTASLVHYVEGDEARALAYAAALHRELCRWDGALPRLLPDEHEGHVRRLRRGLLAGATWFDHRVDGRTASSVAYLPHGFDIQNHPGGRVVVVRAVPDLADAVSSVTTETSTVGVFPDDRRVALRNVIAAAGAATVVPLGQAERSFAGMPQDGTRPLARLVRWVSG